MAGIIAAILPFFLIFFAISLIIFIKSLIKYLNFARELKRIQSNCRSPIITLVTESSAGNIYIRSFK